MRREQPDFDRPCARGAEGWLPQALVREAGPRGPCPAPGRLWGARSSPIQNPYVITIFSAPNYTDTHGNKGAYLNFTGKEYTIETFEHDPHPYVLPTFQDAISNSQPFVAEYCTEFPAVSGGLGCLIICSSAAKIFAQMVAMMSEEDEHGNDEVQQSIKKKLHFLLRTVAGYKLERIQKENELKESQGTSSAHPNLLSPPAFSPCSP